MKTGVFFIMNKLFGLVILIETLLAASFASRTEDLMCSVAERMQDFINNLGKESSETESDEELKNSQVIAIRHG